MAEVFPQTHLLSSSCLNFSFTSCGDRSATPHALIFTVIVCQLSTFTLLVTVCFSCINITSCSRLASSSNTLTLVSVKLACLCFLCGFFHCWFTEVRTLVPQYHAQQADSYSRPDLRLRVYPHLKLSALYAYGPYHKHNVIDMSVERHAAQDK